MSGTAAIFQKKGIVFDDHHFKTAEGEYQTSPPKELSKLYDYLPKIERDDDENSHKAPQKVVMRAGVNELKCQGHCEGVYTLVANTKCEGMPVYKHNTQDLLLAACKVKSEDCWVVARSLTFDTKKQLSLKVATGAGALPFGTSLVWQEWDGRDWAPAPSVKCRASFHGYGLDGGDGWSTHKEASYHELQWEMHKTGRKSPDKTIGSPK